MEGSLKLTRHIAEAAAAVTIVVFLIFSEEASSSALNGIRLCFEKLIPSLFPILTVSGIFVRSGGAEGISRISDRFFKRLFGIGGENALPFVMGLLCSAPAGASALKSIREGQKSKGDDGSLALLLSSSVSVGFFISFVGGQLLNSKKRGLAVFLIQLISTIISALLLRSKKASPMTSKKRPSECHPSFFEMTAASLRDATQGMLSICGSVIFFSSLSGIALSCPISEGAKGFISAFFEITSGSSYISSRFPPDTALVLICAAAGWSGLSMIFQAISSSDSDIPIGKYITGKALSALICPIIALAALKIGII